jgi:hypothetical protein
MNPTIQVDTREWQQAAKELLATSKRSLPDFLNGQMVRVLLNAMDMTKKADQGRIESQLGQTGYVQRTFKKGKRAGQTVNTKKRRINDDYRNTVGWKLYWRVFNDTKKSPLPDLKWLRKSTDPRDLVRAMIAHKVKSIGMISAGWIKSYVGFQALTKKRPPKKQKKRFGSGKALGGSFTPATWRFGNIEAVAANQAVGYRPVLKAWFGGGGNAMGVATEGLQKAINASKADMIATLAKRMKQDMAKNGVR